MNFLDVLRFHNERYPMMKELDFLKLCFQSAFGPGHIIQDKDKARKYFYEEASIISDEKDEVFTPIGNDYVRVDILSYSYSKDELFTNFVRSAIVEEKMKNVYEKYIEILISYCNENDKLDKDLILRLKKEYGYNPFSHSDEYRQVYKPHYRIVKENILFENIKISRLDKCDKTLSASASECISISLWS